jgi:hypothetical protein
MRPLFCSFLLLLGHGTASENKHVSQCHNKVIIKLNKILSERLQN